MPRRIRRQAYRAGHFVAGATVPLIDVVWLSGRLRHSGQPARLLVAGESPWANYLPGILLCPGFERKPITRVRTWNLPRILEYHRNQADLVCVRMDQGWAHLLLGTDYLRVPDWVDAFLDLPDDLASFLCGNSSRATDVRRMQRTVYSWSISHATQDLDMFYSDFYVPFIRQRHGELAYIAQPWSWRRQLARGGLLWVLREGQRVAGGLFLVEGDSIHPIASGCKDQHEARTSLIGTYVFLFMHAHALGIRKLNLGGCRPNTRDGVFRYKRKWGARFVEKTDQYFDLHLWWQAPSPVLNELFMHTPLVFRRKGGLSQLAAVPEDCASAGQISALGNALRSPGLSQICLLGRSEERASIPADVVLLDPDDASSSLGLMQILHR